MRNIIKTTVWILALTLSALSGRATDNSVSPRTGSDAAFQSLAYMDLPQLRSLAKNVAAPQAAALRSAGNAAQSQNYEKRVDNPDGSVTFVEPRFGFPGGESRRISWTYSDAEGVCRLFGYTRYVTGESVMAPAQSMPVINFTGKLSGLKETNFFFKTLICSSATPPEPSTQYKAAFRNDDGSVSISEPRFDYRGTSALISWTYSDAEGVCRLFGYTRYVTGESVMAPAQSMPVINFTGKLSGLKETNFFFKTLVCSN